MSEALELIPLERDGRGYRYQITVKRFPGRIAKFFGAKVKEEVYVTPDDDFLVLAGCATWYRVPDGERLRACDPLDKRIANLAQALNLAGEFR